MVDGLTRIRWIAWRRHPDSKRHMFYNDSIELICRLRSKDLLVAQDEGYVEEENEVNENLEEKDSRSSKNIIIKL